MGEPDNVRQLASPSRKQLTTFLAFWYTAAGVLFVLSVGTVAGLRHGHRIAAFLLLLSAGCFGIGVVVQRARRGRV